MYAKWQFLWDCGSTIYAGQVQIFHWYTDNSYLDASKYYPSFKLNIIYILMLLCHFYKC